MTTSKKTTTPETVESTENTNTELAVINQFSEMLTNAEKTADADFEEVQSGEFLDLVEGQQLTLLFAGFETIQERKTKDDQKAATFYNKNGEKLIATHTVLVSKLQRVDITNGMRVVRIVQLPKPAGKNYFDFSVGVL
jgi:hypothetical protein